MRKIELEKARKRVLDKLINGVRKRKTAIEKDSKEGWREKAPDRLR